MDPLVIEANLKVINANSFALEKKLEAENVRMAVQKIDKACYVAQGNLFNTLEANENADKMEKKYTEAKQSAVLTASYAENALKKSMEPYSRFSDIFLSPIANFYRYLTGSEREPTYVMLAEEAVKDNVMANNFEKKIEMEVERAVKVAQAAAAAEPAAKIKAQELEIRRLAGATELAAAEAAARAAEENAASARVAMVTVTAAVKAALLKDEPTNPSTQGITITNDKKTAAIPCIKMQPTSYFKDMMTDIKNGAHTSFSKKCVKTQPPENIQENSPGKKQ